MGQNFGQISDKIWDMIWDKNWDKISDRFRTTFGTDFGQNLGHDLGQKLGQNFGHISDKILDRFRTKFGTKIGADFGQNLGHDLSSSVLRYLVLPLSLQKVIAEIQDLQHSPEPIERYKTKESVLSKKALGAFFQPWLFHGFQGARIKIEPPRLRARRPPCAPVAWLQTAG